MRVEHGAFSIADGDYQVRTGAHALDEDGPASTVRLAEFLRWQPSACASSTHAHFARKDRS